MRCAAPGRMSAVEQNLLVVTAGADHIAPREGTLPVLDQVAAPTSRISIAPAGTSA
jgi:hypothetical protein